MMAERERVEIAACGTGGQGVIFLGTLVLHAAGNIYPYKSGFPNYAGAVRGGLSEYSIILSKRKILSPILGEADTAILMHRVNFEKYTKIVKPGGKLFVNSSIVREKITRDDIEVYQIPVLELTAGIGENLANLLMLGAYLEKERCFPLENVERALEERMPGEARREALRANKEALRRGAKFISSYGS